MRGDAKRLEDILEAIAKIELYQERGKQAFASDEMLQVWVIHHLQILGRLRHGSPRKPKRDTLKCRGTRSLVCAMCWFVAIFTLI